MAQPQLIGKYQVLERIAVGGMAEIYKAKASGAKGFERLFVIKRILPYYSGNQEFIEMLVTEAKIAVTLSHPNIVQVFDLGEADGDYYIVMEFISGKNVAEIILRAQESNSQLPIEIATYISAEICMGLDYAHRKQDHQGSPLRIVHRDISPHNILVSYEGEVKIVDFGIAKASIQLKETEAGMLKGKCNYMSPEQASGRKLDSRTDIFSTGTVLYEMLTGRNMFWGDSDYEVLEKVIKAQIRPPSLYRRDLPPDLESILMRALARGLDERYERAAGFQEDLSDFLFQAGYKVNAPILSSYVKGLFAEDIELERENLEKATAGLAEAVEEVAGPVRMQSRILPARPPVAEEEGRGLQPAQATQMPHQPPAIQAMATMASPAVVKGLNKGFALSAAVATLGVVALIFAILRLILSGSSATLSVASLPKGAEVILDGEPTNLSTPLVATVADTNISHVVLIKGMAGYGDHQATVRLEPNKLNSVVAILPPLHGTLEVRSQPFGAEVYIGGRLQGTAPLMATHLPVNKELEVRVARWGHEEFVDMVILSPRERKTVIANLEPLTLLAAAPAAVQPTALDVPAPVLPEAPPPEAPVEPPPAEVREEPPQEPLPKPKRKTAKKARKVAKKPPKKAQPSGPKGYVKIFTDMPGTIVWIDGKKAGNLPLTVPLPSGRHTLDLFHPATNLRKRVSINVSPNTVQKFSYKMR